MAEAAVSSKKTSDKNAGDLCARANKAFARRSATDSLRQEIALQFAPWMATFTAMPVEGEDFCSHLLDTTGMQMGRELTNALPALLRPEGRRWARTRVEGAGTISTEGERFFDLHTDVTWGLLYERRARFVRAANAMDANIALFGESTMSIEERLDPRDPGLLFRTWHPSVVAFEENYSGEIDTHFRRFRAPALNICRELGRLPGADLGKELTDLAHDHPQQEVEILHIAIPEEAYDYRYKKRPKRDYDAPERFVSLYVDKSHEHVIRERTVRWSNYVTSRWQMVPGIPDGFSPAAMAALPTSRRLQEMYLSVLENAQKQADPPTMAVAGALINGNIDLDTGGVTYIDAEYDYRTGKPLETIDIGGDMRVALEAVRDARQTMASAWFVNKLSMPADRPKTAYEASLLYQEHIRSTLPIVAPLEDECNAQILSRVVDIGQEVGAYDRLYEALGVPEELGSRELVFEFENPLRDAMQAETQVAFQRMLELVGAAKQVTQQDVPGLKTDAALRDVLNTFRHSKWVMSEREIEEAMAQQQAQQQQMAEMAQAQAMAGAAKDGAQALQAGAGAAAQAGAAMGGAGAQGGGDIMALLNQLLAATQAPRRARFDAAGNIVGSEVAQ